VSAFRPRREDEEFVTEPEQESDGRIPTHASAGRTRVKPSRAFANIDLVHVTTEKVHVTDHLADGIDMFVKSRSLAAISCSIGVNRKSSRD